MARRHGLLALGAATGIVLAATGVLRSPVVNTPQSRHSISPDSLPDGVVARVNDHWITRAEFEQALALQFAEGAIPDATDKQRVLDRMIDEELRVQHAIELNLHRTDGRVRMDLASVITDAAVAGVADDLFDEQVLRDYFTERREYFANRGPIHVRQVWIPIVGGNLGEAFMRARDATTRLREQEPFDSVTELCGSPAPRPIPDKVLAPEELIAYIDWAVINLALTLQPGETSDPIRSLNGYHVLQVLRATESRSRQFRPLPPGC